MKATKSYEIFLLVLTILNNVKNKGEISSNFCGLLRKPKFHFYNQFTLQFKKNLGCSNTSHSAYVATDTESNGAKIDGF